MAIAWVLALMSTAAWVAVLCRAWLRERLDNWRAAASGEQVWFEVVQESGRKNGPFEASAFEGMRMLAHFLNSIKPLSRDRGRITFAWLRSADDSALLTRLYVGVNEHAGDAGRAALRSYAQSIGARLEPVPEGILRFPAEHLVVGQRGKARLADVTNVVNEIGVAAASFASTADAAGSQATCAVYLTLEGMSRGERTMLTNALMTTTATAAGGTAVFAGNSAQAIRQMSDSAVRMSIMAAADDSSPDTPHALLSAVVSASPNLGFSVDGVRPEAAARAHATVTGVALVALFVIMALSSNWLPAVVGLVLAAAGAALAERFGLLVGPYARSAARGEALVPPYTPRPLSVRRGIERLWLRFRMSRNEGGRGQIDVTVAPYPSVSEVIPAHSAALFELLTFPADAQTSTLTASDRLQSRGLPPDMVDVEEGVFVGMSGTGQPVMLDIEDVHYSLYTAGAPNTGKSNFLLVVYAGMVKASIQHTAGLSLSPIWGETKGEGAYDAWRIARHHPRAVFVDVHNPRSGARLALEGRRLSEGETVPNVLSNCTRLVSSLQAAYGDGIKSQAREIFDNVLRCAMLLTAEEIRYVELDQFVNPDKPNIMELSFYLLLGDTRVDPSAKMLALGAALQRSQGLREQELSNAIGSMSRFWGKDSDRRVYLERISTVLNKINDMRRAPMLWSPDARRQDVYIPQLVQSMAPSVVNMGSFYDADTRQFSQSIDRSVSQRLIRSFNYLLWDYIKGHCNGWQQMRKRVPMFFDEVADVAANAQGDDVPNTLEEGTKEGRSRGAAYFLGSQYPSQMPEMVRHQVLASRGKFWFGMQNSSDLDLAVRDLMVDDAHTEGAITASNIKSLHNGVCFATLPRRGSVTPPILLKVPFVDHWVPILFAEHNHSTHDAIADYVRMLDAAEAAR